MKFQNPSRPVVAGLALGMVQLGFGITACDKQASELKDPSKAAPRQLPNRPPAAPTPAVVPSSVAVSPPPSPAAGLGSCPSGMASIPEGSFMMGSNDGSDIEKPVHPVSLDGFCLDTHEVTVAAYQRCVSAGSCQAADTGEYCNDTSKGNHPRNCVSWDDANAYCGYSGKQLPTEAQWAYAARGGSKQLEYSWGSAAPSASNACWDRSGAGTCEVGIYPAGAFGLFDMSGNVWEWTADWYASYPSSASKNHVGPPSGSSRVNRGGSWANGNPVHLRGAYRNWDRPGKRSSYLGFRCARTK